MSSPAPITRLVLPGALERAAVSRVEFPLVERARVTVARADAGTRSVAERQAESLARAVGQARQEGKLEGLAEGRRQGLEQAQRELASLTQSLEAALAASQGRVEQDLHGIEQRLVELVVAVARRIVRCEVDAGRYDLQARVDEALQHVREACRARVHVHPEDLGRLGERRDVEVVADVALERGDVVIETASGRVGQRIGEQLEQIQDALASGGAA